MRFQLGCACLLTAAVFFVTAGCAKKYLPLTYELMNTGINFDEIPNGIDEFDIYAAAPVSKAFAAAVNKNGSVHAWAKA